MKGNFLKNFNFLLRYLRIITLSVEMNQIQYLTDEDFKFTTGIANLYILKNKIKRIDTESFKTIRNYLQHLDLSSNLITSLNGSMRYLTKLTTLKLGHNTIEVRNVSHIDFYFKNCLFACSFPCVLVIL